MCRSSRNWHAFHTNLDRTGILQIKLIMTNSSILKFPGYNLHNLKLANLNTKSEGLGPHIHMAERDIFYLDKKN